MPITIYGLRVSCSLYVTTAIPQLCEIQVSGRSIVAFSSPFMLCRVYAKGRGEELCVHVGVCCCTQHMAACHQRMPCHWLCGTGHKHICLAVQPPCAGGTDGPLAVFAKCVAAHSCHCSVTRVPSHGGAWTIVRLLTRLHLCFTTTHLKQKAARPMELSLYGILMWLKYGLLLLLHLCFVCLQCTGGSKPDAHCKLAQCCPTIDQPAQSYA